MIDKRSKAASSPAQRTLIMKDTLSALVVYGRQEISSPAGFCTTIYSVFVSYIFLYFTNYFTFTEFNIYILFNNLKIKPLSG